MENKTPTYTRKAIDKYNAKFFRATITFPKEYKEIVTAENVGMSVSSYVNELVKADLIKRGLLSAAAESDTTKNSDFDGGDMPFN